MPWRAEHGTTIRSLVEDLAQGTPPQAEYAERAELARAELASALGRAPGRRFAQSAGSRVVAAIAIVLDHTTAAALYDPKGSVQRGRGRVLRQGLRRTR